MQMRADIVCVVVVLRHGNLSLDIHNRVLSTSLSTNLDPWAEGARRQSGMPNRMWRYNGSGISGFLRQLRSENYDGECRRFLEIALILSPPSPHLPACIKKFPSAVCEKIQSSYWSNECWWGMSACDAITTIIIILGRG